MRLPTSMIGPQERLAAHDVGVPARVRSRRDALDDLEDVGPAADPLELVDAPQLVRERELVYGLPTRVQAHHRPVQNPVCLRVEVLGGERLPDHRNRRLGDEHRADYRPLGVQVVRGYERRRRPRWPPRRYAPEIGPPYAP